MMMFRAALSCVQLLGTWVLSQVSQKQSGGEMKEGLTI
jgi:hypothetical protein